MSKDDIVRDFATDLVEAFFLIPLGAVVLALSGWLGVLGFCVGWVLCGVGRVAWRYRRVATS